MNTRVDTATMLAVVDKAVARATYKWKILRLKQHREEARGTLLLIADKMAEKFDGDYWDTTFEQYALDGLIKHAYNCARSALSGVSASRNYLDVLTRESETYGSVEFNCELHGSGETPGALTEAISIETSQEVRKEIADMADDDREILLATCGEGVQPQDLAEEFGGGVTRQAVTGRRDALLRRLRKNERLRDINGARFGGDRLSLDYKHEAPKPLARFRVGIPAAARTAPAVPVAARASLPYWFTVVTDDAAASPIQPLHSTGHAPSRVSMGCPLSPRGIVTSAALSGCPPAPPACRATWRSSLAGRSPPGRLSRLGVAFAVARSHRTTGLPPPLESGRAASHWATGTA